MTGADILSQVHLVVGWHVSLTICHTSASDSLSPILLQRHAGEIAGLKFLLFVGTKLCVWANCSILALFNGIV